MSVCYFDPAFFERKTWGAELHSGLQITENAIIVEKHFPNSFHKTNLQEVLESLNVKQVVIAGMMTHMCIDSTTRASNELSYAPILIADATETKELTYGETAICSKDVQSSFLAALTSFARVLNVDEYSR